MVNPGEHMDIESNVRKHIDKSFHMSLATVSDNKPWVCEVHFAYDSDLNIYFVSKVTTRHCKEIAANQHVAGNIVKQHGLEESPHGVYFEGYAELIEYPSDEELDVYCGRLARDKDELRANLQVENGHRMYRISVQNWAIFGKFGQESNKKYELKWSSK